MKAAHIFVSNLLVKLLLITDLLITDYFAGENNEFIHPTPDSSR